MKFISLGTKRRCQQNKPSCPSVEDFKNARVASHEVHTYSELRQRIHADLRTQHPDWIEPSGESPMCDFYEARLMELLGADAKGLN